MATLPFRTLARAAVEFLVVGGKILHATFRISDVHRRVIDHDRQSLCGNGRRADVIDQRLPAGGTAVLNTTARDHGWKVGSQIHMRFAQTGAKTLRVAAIYNQNQVGDYVVSLDSFAANFPDQFDAQIYVKTAGGPNPQVRQALDTVMNDFPSGKLQDRAQFKNAMLAIGIVFAPPFARVE